MKLSAKRAKRKQKEQKRRRKNLLRQSKCSYCKARINKKPVHITYSKGRFKKYQSLVSKRKVAVILFGAGAAKAWGGSLTSEIDTIIKSDTKYSTLTDNRPVGEFIWKKLEDFYGVENCVNFETFLGVLEFLVDYIFSKTNEGGTSPMNTSFIPVVSSLHSWCSELKGKSGASVEDRIFYAELLKYYYSLVANKVDDYFGAINGIDNIQLNSSLIKYIGYLKTSGYTIRAYTTNYDRLFPLVLRAKFQVFDGFNLKDSEEYYSSYNYDVDKILNDKDCFTYYNLHGCLHWGRSFNLSHLGYRFFCTPNQKHSRLEFRSLETANPGHAILPINIVTGYNKVQRLSIEPLILFYNSFISDCNNAAFLITAGYSFGDYHINRALSLGIQKSHAKHLHISFNNNPSEYLLSMEFQAIRDIQRNSNGFLRITDDPKWLKSDDVNHRRKEYLNGFKEFLINQEWLSK